MSNFKVGDIVKTRDGREVEILKTDAPGRQPIVVMETVSGNAFNRYADGRAYEDGYSRFDLLPPKRTREVTVWVNVYATTHTFHGGQLSAERNAPNVDDEIEAVAVPCKITVEW